MKLKLIIFFVLLSSVIVSAQDNKTGIIQPRERVEMTIWWDVYTNTTSTSDADSLADGIADDLIVVNSGDTVYAELYITPLTSDIGLIEIPLQYGYYHLYKPNYYYDGILRFLPDTTLYDSTALGINYDSLGTVGILKTLYDTLTKRIIFSFQDTSTTYDLNTDTSIVKFAFLTTGVGKQILGIPLSTDIPDRDGYVLRYYAEILRKNWIPYSTTIHNCVIYAE